MKIISSMQSAKNDIVYTLVHLYMDGDELLPVYQKYKKYCKDTDPVFDYMVKI